jgi:Zn-dependent peptidase ImmA (M78 family)
VYCRAEDVDAAADRSLEREANIFAAELLMPEDAVRAEWLRTPQVPAMAFTFGVSPNAVQWRLYNFGLVDDRP